MASVDTDEAAIRHVIQTADTPTSTGNGESHSGYPNLYREQANGQREITLEWGNMDGSKVCQARVKLSGVKALPQSILRLVRLGLDKRSATRTNRSDEDFIKEEGF